ncbi:MAG: hypothetical protein JXA14_11200 [Anaerolineae bacterium]|nr:hypothetical protein [Anaerolineae bacterium]
MSRWTQFRKTFKQPAYRTRIAFFVLLSLVTFLLSILLQPISAFWSDILKDFAVTLGAVGLLQLLWDFLGGDPTELRIEEVREEIKNVGAPLTLLSDLMKGDIGIERIWPDRQTWEGDNADGRKEWERRMCEAERVDIMSSTLWNNWMHRGDFRGKLFNNIAKGAHVRILVYDPNSEVLRLRAKDEDDVKGEMQSELQSTLSRIAKERQSLPVYVRGQVEVHLTDKGLHPAHMIRADNRILVAIYLSGKSGSPSPTLQLRGSESSYFHKYAEQFDWLWNRGKPVDDAHFNRILEEYESVPTPPVEDKVPW